MDAEKRISYLSGFACYCPTVLCICPAFVLLKRTTFGASVNYHHDVIALFFATQYLYLFYEKLIRQTLPRHLKVTGNSCAHAYI